MALSAARDTPGWAPNSVIRSYPQKGSTTIYEGSLVVIDSNGYAKPGVTATDVKTVGRALVTQTNSGSSGDKNISVDVGCFRFANGDAIGISDVGALCYVSDDETVSLSGTSKSIAGTIEAVDSLGVWVSMGILGPIDATALSAYILAVASTATPGGASLVGLFDTASLYTATDVEAAAAEVMKKANAGLIGPMVKSFALSQATSGGLLMTFLAGNKGFITRVDANVKRAATTTAAATLAVKIAGTTVGGGGLSLTHTNCGTQGARVTGSAVTSANTVSANDSITIVAPSASTPFTEGELDVLIWFAAS